MLRQHTKGPTPVPAEERFWRFVNKDGPVPAHVPEIGNCWVWTGARYTSGYGVFRLSYPVRSSTSAHRFAFGQTDLWVLHRCDNRLCVRKSHLFEGTARENIHDMIAKGRSDLGYAARKTQCKRGHDFNEVNTYIAPKSGKRSCKVCHHEIIKPRYRARVRQRRQ